MTVGARAGAGRARRGRRPAVPDPRRRPLRGQQQRRRARPQGPAPRLHGRDEGDLRRPGDGRVQLPPGRSAALRGRRRLREAGPRGDRRDAPDEWAKESPTPLTPAPASQRYGNTVVGPPGRTTWLRIVRRATRGGEDRYTAYTSRDGRTWVRGGTWTHTLRSPRIALAAMGGTGHTAAYDYVRVYRLR